MIKPISIATKGFLGNSLKTITIATCGFILSASASVSGNEQLYRDSFITNYINKNSFINKSLYIASDFTNRIESNSYLARNLLIDSLFVSEELNANSTITKSLTFKSEMCYVYQSLNGNSIISNEIVLNLEINKNESLVSFSSDEIKTNSLLFNSLILTSKIK